MRRMGYIVALLVVLVVPRGAYAQASIAGAVKDASGAVLPGVTVEAASPVLISKVRTVVTDGTGQYLIVDLPPGAYTVTYMLPGFNTVQRAGVELTGSFTATISVDMRVGAVEETITVTGETPVVDIQSTTRQRVISREILDAIPAGRSPVAFGALIPGMNSATNVGGARVSPSDNLAMHGGRGNDQQLTQNGIRLGAMSGTGFASQVNINMAAMQEVALGYSSISAEQWNGGVQINLIPRDGGNTLTGTAYFNFANAAMQGNNLTADLKTRGLSTVDSLRRTWDINPGVGGPIKKDRVWFYFAPEYRGSFTNVAGMFENKNANNPAVWTYEPDTSRPASNETTSRDATLRLLWQVTPRNKIGIMPTFQAMCQCPQAISATRAPEADSRAPFPKERKVVIDWSSPMTNRVLWEAGIVPALETTRRVPVPGLNPAMIAVQEQSTGLFYRSGDPQYRVNRNMAYHSRLAVSYITGAHAVKVGMTHTNGNIVARFYSIQPLTYRLNSGVPNQLTMLALPVETRTNIDHDFGLFAQDSWRIDRLTLGYGIRYSYFRDGFPEQSLGPTAFIPARNITFPAQTNLSWNDLTPRLGASYDLFGTGKTALKVSINKYLENLAGGGLLTADPNPAVSVVRTVTRAWTDANRNFVPDCDLSSAAANGECGAMADPNFGKLGSRSTYDPDLMRGWNKRGYNWEFSAGVQHELLPRVAAEVSYFRRWYGNFFVTDNRAVAASDFDRFTVTAPVDSRLPSGGGNVITGLYNLNPAKFGVPSDNFVTLASRYGEQRERWHGVDVTVNVRPRSGLVLQGGVSTGNTVTDNCEVAAKVPEILLGALTYCHQETKFLTQVKSFASYTIPRVDVQVSGVVQSLPGPVVLANYNAPNAAVAPSLGRNLSGNAANVTVGLVAPGTMYGERLNQLDLRVGKLVRVGGTRTTFSVDIYNALNASTVLTQQDNFAVWQRPTSILLARFAKLNVQFDF